MISQDIDERGGKIEIATYIRKLSNHSPLIITVWGQHPPPGNPPQFFDTSLLNEEKSKQEMLKAWVKDQSHPSNDQNWLVWLEATIGRVMHNNMRFAIEKKRTQGACVRTHAKKIQLAEIQLQRDPFNVEVRDILSDT